MATSIFHLEDGYINTNSYNNKYFKRLPLVLVFSIVNWNSMRKEKGNTVELALKIRPHLSSFYIQITKEITSIYCVDINVNFFYLSIAIFTEYMYLVCQISWFIYTRVISSQKSNVLHFQKKFIYTRVISNQKSNVLHFKRKESPAKDNYNLI